MTDSKTAAAAAAASTEAKMEYRFLGRSGLKVSALSLGPWGGQTDDEALYALMKAAFKAGINTFDNAEAYGGGQDEINMGKWIKRLMAEEKVDRSQLVIITKIFWGLNKGPNQKGLSRKRIIEGLKASLKRLQLEYVDVVMAHRPDPETPIEETVRAFNWVIDHGLAFYWGTSEWSAEQIKEAQGVADKLGLIGPVADQPQYSMLHRRQFEVGYAQLFKETGLGATIWSPLACGVLTGKYNKGKFPEGSRMAAGEHKWLRDQLTTGQGMNGLEMKDFDRIIATVEKLEPIAAKLKITQAQLALAWVMRNKNVSTIITGVRSKQQLDDNIAAFAAVKLLTPAVIEEIEAVLQNKPAAPMDWKLLF